MKFEVRYGFILGVDLSGRNVVVSQQSFQLYWRILLYYRVCTAETICCSLNKEVAVRHAVSYFWNTMEVVI